MGTGISKIRNLLSADNKREPEFEFNNFFTVTFFREISSEKIKELMKINPKISARTISEKIGISQRAVEKSIRNLKQCGVLKRIGSPKNGYWKVLK